MDGLRRRLPYKAAGCLLQLARLRGGSLSSVLFQPLSMLHPLGHSLSPRHPRAKVRSRTLNLTRKVSMPAGWRAEHPQHGFGSAPGRAPGVPAVRSSKVKHLTHPNPTHASPHLSRAGPKSGTCLIALLAFQHITETGGARVAPGSAPGVGLASAGKTRGEALPRVVPEGFPKHVKRAFPRAKGRAARSLCGGTWYRGKWHDSSTLQALSKPSSRPVLPPLRVNRRPVRRSKTDLCMLSWNTSGLGGGVYQELLAWLEHPEHTAYQLVVLQETHWHQVSDYCSGGWQCIHSSGFVEGAKPDRSSGLLIMLAKAFFCDIATQELHAGRLLHVQTIYKPTGLPITILALYQHVWRTQLSSSENLRLQGEILSSIKHILDHTPTRHHLVLAGDFNASLSPERASVGPAAPSQVHPNHCAQLQQLLVDHQLVATNTWHAKPWHTYCSSGVSIVKSTTSSRGLLMLGDQLSTRRRLCSCARLGTGRSMPGCASSRIGGTRLSRNDSRPCVMSLPSNRPLPCTRLLLRPYRQLWQNAWLSVTRATLALHNTRSTASCLKLRRRTFPRLREWTSASVRSLHSRLMPSTLGVCMPN